MKGKLKSRRHKFKDSMGTSDSSRYYKPFNPCRDQFLTLAQIAEMKQSEASVNAEQKREGTRHPTTAIVWGCRCCYGYTTLRDRTIANTTVQEEERKRAKFSIGDKVLGGKIVQRCSYETTIAVGVPSGPVTFTNWRYLVEKRDFSRPRHYGVAYKCEWFAEWDLENRLKEEDYNKRKHRC